MEKDTSPLVPSIRRKKQVRITEDNDVMIFMNTSQVYPSDHLPEWFQPLQVIVEDWVFTCMVITLGDVHYHIDIVEDTQDGQRAGTSQKQQEGKNIDEVSTMQA